MLHRICLLTLGFLTILSATTAFAIDEPRVPGSPPNLRPTVGQGGAPIFRRLDANKDGQVSKLEFEKAAQKVATRAPGKAGGKTGARVFDRLDTDNNGSLSPAELEKLKQLRARRNGGR
jgi:hypothetical protein